MSEEDIYYLFTTLGNAGLNAYSIFAAYFGVFCAIKVGSYPGYTLRVGQVR